MSGIEYENIDSYKRNRQMLEEQQASVLERAVINAGIVSSAQGAKYVLVLLTIAFFSASGFLFYKFSGLFPAKSSTSTSEALMKGLTPKI